MISLIDAADKAPYDVKTAGRNRVVIGVDLETNTCCDVPGSHDRNRLVGGSNDGQRQARCRVLKGAHITFKGHWAAIDCVVRNLSDRGACLKVESPIGIPDSFDLVLGGPGFEPRLTESESAILPLNDPPPDGRRSSVGWTYPSRGATNGLRSILKKLLRAST
jgi:hypothetical protein